MIKRDDDREDKVALKLVYQERFPGAKKHHLHPKKRGGPDSEFNLFPWNEKAHSAWHKVFDLMTVREIWPLLEDVHQLIFQSRQETIVPEWRAVLCTARQLKERRGAMSPLKAAKLRQWWVICFGSDQLVAAKRLIRYMMLFMVFGHNGDNSRLPYDSAWLRRVLTSMPPVGDRAWAFRQCFRRMPQDAKLRHLKRMVHSARDHGHAVLA